MLKNRDIAMYFLSLSLLVLAGALIYSATQLAEIPVKTRDAFADLEQSGVQLGPIIGEVQEIRKLIPGILNEVKQVRKLVPGVMAEVRGLQEQLPKVLRETEKVRNLTPSVLEEIKQTRLALPEILTKAENIVEGSKKLGREAGEGAVSGVLTGIITTPFRVVGGIGRTILGSDNKNAFKLNDEDNAKIIATMNHLVLSGEIDTKRSWENRNSGNKGTVIFKGKKMMNGKEVSTFQVQIQNKEKKRIDKEVNLRLKDDSSWEVVR